MPKMRNRETPKPQSKPMRSDKYAEGTKSSDKGFSDRVAKKNEKSMSSLPKKKY